MKRSLIMLLVVALLSTLLVPAMAAETGKKAMEMTFASDEITKDLDGYAFPWLSTNSFTIANIDADTHYYVKWTSSNEDAVWVDPKTDDFNYEGDKATGTVNVFYINPSETVTITGHVYTTYNEDMNVEKAFKVTPKEVPAKTVIVHGTEKIVQGGSYWFSADVQSESPDMGATFQNVDWKVEPSDMARITTDGRLFVNKDAKVGEKLKVTATTQGATPVSKTVEVTITPAEEGSEIPGAVYYNSIKFSSEKFTLALGGSLNLSNYFTLDPIYSNDDLVWSCDDETIVTLPELGRYSDPDHEGARTSGYWIAALKEGTTKLHVKSKYNKDFKEATIEVTVSAPKPFEKLAFSGVTEITLDLYAGEELRKYLDVKPQNNDDALVWTSDNPQVVSVDEETGDIITLQTGDAKISVRSLLKPEVKTETPMTIHVVEAKDEENLYTELKFSEQKLTMTVGEVDVDLDAYLVTTPNYIDVLNDRVLWSSSDPTVAIVDDNGIVTAVKKGTTTITARSLRNPDCKVGTITIEVNEAKKDPPIKSLAFIQDEVKLNPEDFNNVVGLGRYLKIEPADYDYDEEDLVWTSDNPQFVTVVEGKVLFTESTPNPDSAKITVYAKENPQATASIKVTLVNDKVELKNLTFTDDKPTEMTLGKDEIHIWDYIITDPADFDRNDLVFESSDPRVAFVGPYGYLYAGKVGSVTITVYAKGSDKKYTFPITVKTIPVTAVIFNKDATYKMKVGESIDLFTTNYLSFVPDSINQFDENVDLTWTSSDEEIATVNSFGSVIGKKPGNATITVLVRNADGSTAEGKVEVTVEDAANKLTGIAFKKGEFKLEVGTGYDINEHHIAISKMFKFTPADIDVTAYDWTKFDFYSSNDDVVKFVRVETESDGSEYVPCFVFRTFKPGTVKITAQSRENAKLKAKTKLTVVPIKVKKIARPTKFKSIDMPLYDVESGSEENFSRVNFKNVHVNVTPAYAYYEAKWETSDASVAYVVEESGNEATIKAVAPGTCKIKVTVTDGTNTFTRDMFVTVKAAKVTKLALNRSKVNAYIIKGAENTFQLTATDAKTGYEVPVKWTSSDAKVAKVYQSGKVKFLTAGTAKITATTKDGNKVSKSCTFTVKKLAVTEVKPASKSVTIKVGGEKTLKAKVKPAKAFNTALYFKSSNTKVVAVDQDGVVLGLKPGKATITITARDGSKKSATITVYVKAVTAANDGELEVLDGDLAIEGELLENSFDIEVAGEGIVIADDEAVELSVD